MNLSTSRVTEELARRLGCPVHRTPVGEIHVVERMRAESAVLGGEGNGGVIDPRVGFVRDSFVAMALVLDLLAETGEPLSRLVDRLAAVSRWSRTSIPWRRRRASRGRRRALGPDQRRPTPRRGRPPRRPPARLARPLGPRPSEQHRADRPRDRRGRRARRGAGPGRPDRPLGDRGGGAHEPGPPSSEPPAAAFVDVDGTLLAQTTTYLFARILRRRGLIKRSFVLRALYHGLQHRFGRLDYGRLVTFGLQSIARIPVVELERIAYDNFVEFVRPRLYEGVVEHLTGLRRVGDGRRARLVVARDRDRAPEPLPRLHRHDHDTGRDRTRPARRNRSMGHHVTARESCYWAERWAADARNLDGRFGRLCG